ncbi:hypothetical protein ACOBQX_18075 [Actinokineospora sp. G85]
MSTVMIELTAPPVADDAVVMLDDVEELGAYSRCNCAASDDNPY